jgi:hypothetical protein
MPGNKSLINFAKQIIQHCAKLFVHHVYVVRDVYAGFLWFVVGCE